MTSVWLAIAAAALLGLAAVYDHAALIGRRVVETVRGGWRPRELAARPPAPDQEPAVVLVGGHPERGLDHNDATTAEVLAMVDALAADVYPRITVLEDDTEIALPARPVEPTRGQDVDGWRAFVQPARRLVLVRCPVGGAW